MGWLRLSVQNDERDDALGGQSLLMARGELRFDPVIVPHIADLGEGALIGCPSCRDSFERSRC